MRARNVSSPDFFDRIDGRFWYLMSVNSRCLATTPWEHQGRSARPPHSTLTSSPCCYAQVTPAASSRSINKRDPSGPPRPDSSTTPLHRATSPPSRRATMSWGSVPKVHLTDVFVFFPSTIRFALPCRFIVFALLTVPRMQRRR